MNRSGLRTQGARHVSRQAGAFARQVRVVRVTRFSRQPCQVPPPRTRVVEHAYEALEAQHATKDLGPVADGGYKAPQELAFADAQDVAQFGDLEFGRLVQLGDGRADQRIRRLTATPRDGVL